MNKRVSSILALGAVLLGAACAAPSGSATSESAQVTAKSLVRVMKMHPSSTVRAADEPGPSGAKLVYYGGPVLANVKIYAVYWGSNVQAQDHINAFFPAITNSPYFDWLSEYNTSSQQIGRGSFGGSVIDTTAPSSTTVSDQQIQTEIAKLIDAGKLPANDGNNLYMMYFPPGVTITGPNGSGTSCEQFCAYHGTFTKSGSNAYYGVMPDLGGACASGCGGGSYEDNITEVSSHEMIEAVTDGAVGLATQAGPPLAWYDNNNGEIGDICVGKGAQVAGFMVQLEWSNKLGLCTSTGQGGSTSSSSGGSSSGGSSSGGSSSGGSSSGGSSSGGSSSGGSSSGGTCNHDVCTAGGSLSTSCDPCVGTVCSLDSGCCASAWDQTCVELASILCSACGGN
jgi:hypothetical protein